MIPVSLVYFGYFAALGAFWPYYGPLLVSFGLSTQEATQVIAIGPAFGFVTPPIAGLVADALRARSVLLRALTAGALVSFLGFFVVVDAWWVVVTVILFSAGRSPVVALVDASALAVERGGGASYGRMRLWGSIGFLGAALIAAELAGRGGPRAVLPLTVALLALAAVAAWFIAPAAGERGGVLRAWLERLRHPPMWLFVGAAAVGGAAHAMYDSAFSLHLGKIGLGGRFVGMAWALGVAAEVLLLFASRRLIARFGAERLFALTFAVAAVRWMVLAELTSPEVILALQPLHGITFGMCWVTGVNVAHDHGSPRAPAAAQGLFVASGALGAFIGMTLAGGILERWGGSGMFHVAASLSAIAAASACVFALVIRPGRGRGPGLAAGDAGR